MTGSAVFAAFTIVTDRQTDHDTQSVTIGCIYVVVRCRLIISRAVLYWQDGTNQSHSISEIYNVRLYQSTNFLNVPHTTDGHYVRLDCCIVRIIYCYEMKLY